MQRTAASSPVGTDRGQDALWCGRQREEFVHDAQDQFRPVSYSELVMKALDVRVDGVRRDIEVGGNGEFGAVVENGFHNLKFPFREFQTGGDFPPCAVG